jgi:hypothetical protein
MNEAEKRDLVKLPYSKYKWEERAEGRRYVLHHKSGVIFEWSIIDPERESKNGAWPYCLGYQVDRVDFFGLGSYGSNIRVEIPEGLDAAIDKFVKDEGDKTILARAVSKMGSRAWELGDKYMVRFSKPGVFHHGTFFESYADIERYLRNLVSNKENFEAKVYLAPQGEAVDYLGTYRVEYGPQGEKTTTFEKVVA